MKRSKLTAKSSENLKIKFQKKIASIFRAKLAFLALLHFEKEDIISSSFSVNYG